MSAVDVAAIRARAEAATEGPWRVVGRYVALIGPVGVAQGQPAIDALTETDAEFIAAARTDVPALCDEVERLREQRNALVNEAHDWIAVAKSNEADLAAARATLARVKALTDEWDSNPDSECTLGWAADRLNAALSPPETPAVSTRSEDVDVEATITRVATEHCLQQGAGGFHSWRCDYPDRYGECDCLAEFVADLTAALSAPVPDDEPFYFDSVTGEPCPRKGNVLCIRPYDPDHRHRAAPVPDVAAEDAEVWFDHDAPLPEFKGEPIDDVAAERVAAIKAEALREARAFVGSASRPNRAEIDRWLSRQVKDCDRAAAEQPDDRSER
jgi:hypothetical protein